MKRRDLMKRLEDAGFEIIRDIGDHTVLQSASGKMVIVPRHREINENTARAILKGAGLS